MANKTFSIRIESIMGGKAPMTHFAAPDQFRASLGIDPSLPTDNSDTSYSSIASGLIRPVGVAGVGSSTAGSPMWIEASPKTAQSPFGVSHYIYSSSGSVYSISFNSNLTGVGDLNDGGTSGGNGCAYYDNYMYFARSTTIARYGPLNGTPSFTDDYWVGTLGKTALTNTQYPADPWAGEYYSNHVLHRHSDGKLYIADVVGNTGTLHYIKTKKTTVEGDTDDGSTYDKLHFGYGLYPIDIESYGDFLVIALIESNGVANGQPVTRSKIAFWDTTSDKTNQIIWAEFPDAMVTAIVNANGILFFFSGSTDDFGYRVTKYVGGSSFQEVALEEMGFSPHAGAVLGKGNQIMFGSANTVPTYADSTLGDATACVWSLGLRSNLSTGLFNIARASDSGAFGVTALASTDSAANFNQQNIIFGYSGTIRSIDSTFQTALNAANPPVFWSQVFRIGQRFKITKIRIPTIVSGSSYPKQITPKIYLDDGSQIQTLRTLDYGTGTETFTIRPTNAEGQYDFWIELSWTGADSGGNGGTWAVGLPITIDYELIDE